MIRGYAVLSAAVIMQLCLGATYSWSVYVAAIRTLTGLSQGTVQLPFSLFYFIFPLTMIFSGTILSGKGPRFCAVTGGVLFGGGWLMAAWGDVHFLFTVVGIGLIAGTGAGLAYIVPLSTCIKWFPRHKGMVTGIAVAGFGGGAALVSQIGGMIMTNADQTPFNVFAFMGVLFLILISLAGYFMQDPIISEPEESTTPSTGKNTEAPTHSIAAPGHKKLGKKDLKKNKKNAVSTSEIISTRRFRILYFAMFSGLAAGFAVNANLKELYAGSAAGAGVTAVSLFALANAAGRISWGAVVDRFNPAWVLKINLIAQALLLLCSFFLLKSKEGFYLFSLGAGFNYGGVLVLYASSSAAIWGAGNMGRVYGWLFSSNIPAALAPVFAGWCFDMQGNFFTPFLVIALLLIVSVMVIHGKFRHIKL